MLGGLFFPLLKRAKKKKSTKKEIVYIYTHTGECKTEKLESKIWVNEALDSQDSEFVSMFR